MSKRQILSLIGVWIASFLFLGLPPLWHKILAIISGIFIIIIAYNLESKDKKDEIQKMSDDQGVFTENNQ